MHLVLLHEESAPPGQVADGAEERARGCDRLLVRHRLGDGDVGEALDEVAGRGVLAGPPRRAFETERAQDPLVDELRGRRARRALDHLTQERVGEVRVVPLLARLEHLLGLARAARGASRGRGTPSSPRRRPGVSRWMPAECASARRIVTPSRFASGMCAPSGSSSFSFPSSRSIRIARATNVFVIDAIAYWVSGVASRLLSTSASPTDSAQSSSSAAEERRGRARCRALALEPDQLAPQLGDERLRRRQGLRGRVGSPAPPRRCARPRCRGT